MLDTGRREGKPVGMPNGFQAKDHPRGQPGNAGQFKSKPVPAAPLVTLAKDREPDTASQEDQSTTEIRDWLNRLEELLLDPDQKAEMAVELAQQMKLVEDMTESVRTLVDMDRIGPIGDMSRMIGENGVFDRAHNGAVCGAEWLREKMADQSEPIGADAFIDTIRELVDDVQQTTFDAMSLIEYAHRRMQSNLTDLSLVVADVGSNLAALTEKHRDIQSAALAQLRTGSARTG